MRILGWIAWIAFVMLMSRAPAVAGSLLIASVVGLFVLFCGLKACRAVR
jgi:hypothetical protein